MRILKYKRKSVIRRRGIELRLYAESDSFYTWRKN